MRVPMEIRKKMKSSKDVELARTPKAVAKVEALTKQVVKLNAKGMSPDKIAKKLKVHPSKVRMMIQEVVCSPERLEALNDLTLQRAAQAHRLEQLIDSRMESAIAGDNSDFEAVRKVMADQNKLLGLTEKANVEPKTQKVEISGAVEHSGAIDHSVDVDVSGEIAVAVTHDFSQAQAKLDKFVNRKAEEKQLPANTHKSKRNVRELLNTLDTMSGNDEEIEDAVIVEDEDN